MVRILINFLGHSGVTDRCLGGFSLADIELVYPRGIYFLLLHYQKTRINGENNKVTEANYL